MKSRFLLALFGATTLIPAVAVAQEVPEIGGPPRIRERAERFERPRMEAPEARAEFNVNADRVRAPERRAEPREPRPGVAPPDWTRQGSQGDRGDRGEGRGWRGPDGGQGGIVRRADPPRDAQGQIDREQLRRQWQATRPGLDRDNDGPRRDQWQRDGQQRDQWQRDGQRRDQWRQDEQRRDWDRPRADRDRRDDWRRDNDGRGWGGGWNRSDSDWRDNGRYQRDWNDRQQWNRAWRNDNRYNWSRYRDANRGLYRLPRYYAPQGWNYGYRRFGIGVTLNSFLFGQNYWINDPFYYRLPDAYGPYRWVRYYNDALLVDVRTGRVLDVEYDIFW